MIEADVLIVGFGRSARRSLVLVYSKSAKNVTSAGMP
jgi:hypothetical protein